MYSRVATCRYAGNCYHYLSNFPFYRSFFIGEPTFVARVIYRKFSGCVPGAVIPSAQVISVPWGCVEHTLRDYEILTCDDPDMLCWKTCSQGQVPPTAILAGTNTWENMYIGQSCDSNFSDYRAQSRKHLDSVLPKGFQGPLLGKIQPSHGCLYIAHAGDEYRYHTYNVLCTFQLPRLTHLCTPTWSWTRASDGRFPEGTLSGGTSPSGEVTYVARANHRQQLVPGKLVTSEQCCLVCWGSAEHRYRNYETLVVEDPAEFEWVLASQGQLPNGAVPGYTGRETIGIGRTVTSTDVSNGRTCTDFPIPIPRSAVRSTQLLGKIHPSHRCLYVPYQGLEFIYRAYEALAIKYSPKSLRLLCRNVILTATNGSSKRIDRLPLPPFLKEFCKVTDSELND